MKTSIKDIRTRLRYLSEDVASPARFKYVEERARDMIERKSINQAIKTLELGIKNNCIYENTVFDLFDLICENGFEGQIDYATNLICNEWVQRSRNASDALEYIHQKLGRIKGKINTDTNTVTKAMEKLKSSFQPVDVSVNVPKVSAPSVGGAAPKKATTEAYEAIQESIEKVIQADRIINNYNVFSKRFNIDKTILENIMISSVPNTVIKICELMDTYNIDDKRKYSMAMENAWYGLHKNGITATNEDIVTYATNYFLAKGNNNSMCRNILENSLVVDKKDYKGNMEVITEEEPEDDLVNEVSYINDKNEKVPKECKCGGKVKVVFAGEPIFKCDKCGKYYGTVPFKEAKLASEDRKELDSSSFGIPSMRKFPLNDKDHIRAAVRMFNKVDSDHEAELAKNLKAAIKKNNMQDEINVGKSNRFYKYYKPTLKETADGNTEFTDVDAIKTTIENIEKYPDSEFNKVFNVIKVNNEGSKEEQLAILIPIIFNNSEDKILKYTFDLLDYIETILLPNSDINLDAVNNVIDGIEHGILTSGLSQLTVKEFRDRIQQESLKRLWRIVDNFEEGVGEQYKLYTTRMLKLYNALDGYTTHQDIDKPIDSTITEESILYIPIMSSLLETRMMYEDNFFDTNKLYKILSKAPTLAESMVEFSKLCPEIIYPSYLNEALSILVSHVDIGKYKIGGMDRYSLRNALIESAKSDNIDKKYEDMDKEIENVDAVEEITRLSVGNEVLEAMMLLYQASAYSSITESSFKNNIILAKEKIKHGIQKLNDKQKAAWKNIDVASNNFIKGVEKALTNDNREAVIKGSVLPSASKTLKLGLSGLVAGGIGAGVGHATGIALMGPAMAAIPILGYIGVSKKFKAKERQMVIDEIEIELKMVAEYIDLAKSKNDLKALRELLMAQRELERQRQRIKYKMQVHYGQKYYDADKTIRNNEY